MYFIEIRSTVHRRGAPRLVPLGEVGNYSGFRSVVAYDAEVAALIREQGGTHGLRGRPVYADTLFMDFDNHDPVEFRNWLRGSGLAYQEFDSGGRSVHFHVPLVPVFGPWVTAALKEWVRERAPTADVSFYHNAGMYRLPGTYHSKHAGRRKELVSSGAGEPLVLTAPTTKLPEFRLDERGGVEALFLLLTERKTEGHRQPFVWRLAITAAEAGLTFDDALDHIRWWSARFCDPPHADDILRRQCESAYRSISRRSS